MHNTRPFRAPCILFLFSILAQAYALENVIIDLSKSIGPARQRGIGFLHSLSPTWPPDSLLKPLKPSFYRTGIRSDLPGWSVYDRVTKLGMTFQVVVSDGTSAADYVAHAENLVRYALQRGYKVQWDLSNEGIQFDQWNEAYRAIRAIDSNAVIVGPSCIGISKLLDFCKMVSAEKTAPDYLSWHFGPPWYVESDVTWANTLIKGFRLPTKGVIINERNGYTPGQNAVFVAGYEKMKVFGSSFACWGTCQSPMLDGVLMRPPSVVKTPLWHAIKTYADISGTIVDVTPGTTMHAVAGYDSIAPVLRIYLGRSNGTGRKEMDAAALPPDTLALVVKGIDRSRFGTIADLTFSPINVYNLGTPFTKSGNPVLPDGTLEIRAPAPEAECAYGIVVTFRSPLSAYRPSLRQYIANGYRTGLVFGPVNPAARLFSINGRKIIPAQSSAQTGNIPAQLIIPVNGPNHE